MAEVLEQLHVAADTDQKALFDIEDGLPKLITDEARVAAKERLFREFV